MNSFNPGSTITYKFNTRDKLSAPITFAGSPQLAVYKDSSTTESTAGITLTVDFDGVVGMHHVTINTAADPTFYSANSSFQLVVTSGTVDGVSVVGAVIAEFTLSNIIEDIADAVLSRDVSNVESTTADHSLASMVLAVLEWAITNNILTIYKTDGITPHLVKTVTTNGSASPVTRVD